MPRSTRALRARALELGTKRAAAAYYDTVRDLARGLLPWDATTRELQDAAELYADKMLEEHGDALADVGDEAFASAARPPWLPLVAPVKYSWIEAVPVRGQTVSYPPEDYTLPGYLRQELRDAGRRVGLGEPYAKTFRFQAIALADRSMRLEVRRAGYPRRRGGARLSVNRSHLTGRLTAGGFVAIDTLGSVHTDQAFELFGGWCALMSGYGVDAFFVSLVYSTDIRILRDLADARAIEMRSQLPARVSRLTGGNVLVACR